MIVIIDKSNYLFTQVKTALGSNIKGSSQTYEASTPVDLPYMFFNVLDNSQAADDLSNNENAVNMTVEITFFASGTSKLTTCKNLMAIASDKMRVLGFRRVFGPQQITNVSDTTICRYVARYNRIIGAGDTL